MTEEQEQELINSIKYQEDENAGNTFEWIRFSTSLIQQIFSSIYYMLSTQVSIMSEMKKSLQSSEERNNMN